MTVADDTASALVRTVVHPAVETSVLRDRVDAEPALRGARLTAAVERAGLRGRGGASFPAGAKWRAVSERSGPRVVVANGAEGEPASFKDRWLMRHRPEMVVDGLLRCGEAVGADEAYIVCCDRDAATSVRRSLAERRTEPAVTVVELDPAYVAGEETAAIQALNGGPAMPTSKPPRPYERGVHGRPTLVHNVETLARVALLAGAPDGDSAENVLLTVRGPRGATVVYEAPMRCSLGEAIEGALGCGATAGVLTGGFFSGLLGPAALDRGLADDELRAMGSGLGCGAITVLGREDCPVRAAAWVQGFFARESTGQCGSCVNGTRAMGEAVARLADGVSSAEDLARLERWSTSLRGRGACALLDGATQVAASLLREFPAAVAAHRAGTCRCRPWRPEYNDGEV